MFILFVVLAVVALLVLLSCIKIVPQAQAIVVERLGAYLDTWSVGVHFKMPFVDRVAKRIILKEQVVDFPPQPVITKDNVTMKIDTVVFFQITDPKLFAYGVENPIMAIENLTATTLRNIIGDLELDQTLTSRETINTKMRAALDVATDPWGIKVNRVELKNIIPPAAIQDAMEKQMKAERERREAILRAEGEKKSTVLVAEGQKASAILEAEAEKEAAEAEAAITAAEQARDEASASVKTAEGAFEAATTLVTQKEAAVSAAQQELASAQAALSQAQNDVAAREEERDEALAALDALSGGVAGTQDAFDKATETLANAQGNLDAARTAEQEAAERATSTAGALSDAQRQHELAEAAANQAHEAAKQAQANFDDAKAESDRLAGLIDALDQAQASHAQALENVDASNIALSAATEALVRAETTLADAQAAKAAADEYAEKTAALSADDALADGIDDPVFAELDALFETARDAAAEIPAATEARNAAASAFAEAARAHQVLLDARDTAASNLTLARANYDAALAAQQPAKQPSAPEATAGGETTLAQTGDEGSRGLGVLALFSGGALAVALASRRKIANRRH